MTLEEVKEALYDITDMFFKGATVIWTEQSNTKPPLPYVTLKLGAVQRTAFPVVMDDGSRFYPCSTIVEINLYTKGKPVRVGDNITGNYINTATSDMMEFFNFVESDEVTDILAARGIGVTLMPPVRDLTDLQNDSYSQQYITGGNKVRQIYTGIQQLRGIRREKYCQKDTQQERNKSHQGRLHDQSQEQVSSRRAQ